MKELKTGFNLKITLAFHFAPENFAFHIAPFSPTQNFEIRNPFDTADDLNGSVGSIADLIPKGSGFESQISHGFSLM
jgi:hypothetical protein